MRESIKSLYRKILTGYGFVVFTAGLVAVLVIAPTIIAKMGVMDLLASVTDSFGGGSTTLFFMPYGNETVAAGETTTIDVDVNTKVPINAAGITIDFSSSTLEIVGISKEKSLFNLWTQDTSISEDNGTVSFSGGTTLKGGIIGTGTLLTLTVRAKSGDKTKLSFADIQVYPSDGSGKPVAASKRSITYTIESPSGPGMVSQDGGASVSAAGAAPVASADLNGDGKVDLIDLSILVAKLLLPYDPRFDLNSDGAVNLGDLAVLLSKMGK